MMKQLYSLTKFLTLGILLVFVSFGCEEFLQEEPQGLLNPTGIIVSDETAESVLLSAYANLKYHPDRTDNGLHYWRGIWHFSEIPSDDCTMARRQFDASRFTVDPTYGVLIRNWEELYSVINRTNTLITRLPEIESISDEDKNSLLGEARFLRAFMYFKLVRLWGGVPLKLEETSGIADSDIAIPRSTDLEVYMQIEADLLFAEANAPDDHDGAAKSRATKNAAKALLAKVYLQWAGEPLNDASKWQLAASKAAEVTGSLVQSSYADVFALSNESNDEIILELEGNSGFGTVWNPSQGNILSRVCMPRGGDFAAGSPTSGISVRGTNDYIPSFDLFNSFEEGDTRRTLVDTVFVVNGTRYSFTRPFFWKFMDPSTLTGGVANWDSGINYPFLRYADILLVKAEALNEVSYGNGEAFAAINQVRNRAGLPDLNPVDVPDQVSFRNALLSERRKELYMEESRYYDLIRHDIAVSTLQAFAENDEEGGRFSSANITREKLLLPIPQGEIDTNPAISSDNQNPGY